MAISTSSLTGTFLTPKPAVLALTPQTAKGFDEVLKTITDAFLKIYPRTSEPYFTQKLIQYPEGHPLAPETIEHFPLLNKPFRNIRQENPELYQTIKDVFIKYFYRSLYEIGLLDSDDLLKGVCSYETYYCRGFITPESKLAPQQKELSKSFWKKANQNPKYSQDLKDLYRSASCNFWNHIETCLENSLMGHFTVEGFRHTHQRLTLCIKQKKFLRFACLENLVSHQYREKVQAYQNPFILLHLELQSLLKQNGAFTSKAVHDAQLSRKIKTASSTNPAPVLPDCESLKRAYYRDCFGSDDIALVEQLASEISFERQTPLYEFDKTTLTQEIRARIEHKKTLEREALLKELAEEDAATPTKPTKKKPKQKPPQRFSKQITEAVTPKKATEASAPQEPISWLQEALTKQCSSAELHPRVKRWRTQKLSFEDVRSFPDLNSDGSKRYAMRSDDEIYEQILFHQLFGIEQVIGTQAKHPLRDFFAIKDLYKDHTGMVREGFRFNARIEIEERSFEGTIFARYTSQRVIYHLHFIPHSSSSGEDYFARLFTKDPEESDDFGLIEGIFKPVGEVAFETTSENNLILRADNSTITLFPNGKYA